MKLDSLAIGKVYRLVDCQLREDIRKHLSHLGLQTDSTLRLISKTKDNAIIQVKASRLALDKAIIEALTLVEHDQDQSHLPLSDLKVGKQAQVVEICATGALKRRLMDMGLTKETKLYLKKVAPLGDPIEITLRGYELTLRKSEAQMVRVQELGEDTK